MEPLYDKNGNPVRIVRVSDDQSPETLKRLSAAMREADKTFERVGGSTKHHVRDCLLPILEKHGLTISCNDTKEL